MPQSVSKRKSPGKSSQATRQETENHARFLTFSNARGNQSAPRRIRYKVIYANTKISTDFVSNKTRAHERRVRSTCREERASAIPCARFGCRREDSKC